MLEFYFFIILRNSINNLKESHLDQLEVLGGGFANHSLGSAFHPNNPSTQPPNQASSLHH